MCKEQFSIQRLAFFPFILELSGTDFALDCPTTVTFHVLCRVLDRGDGWRALLPLEFCNKMQQDATFCNFPKVTDLYSASG